MKVRIGILGIGGVGGFYGGLLATHYQKNSDVEIVFIARGANLEAITEDGIKVCEKEKEYVGRPSLAVDCIQKAGKLDYIILATKGYDLEGIIADLKQVVKDQTVVIPLLNGVEAYEKLVEALPKGAVWQGCTYIVTRLTKPGVVDNPSGRQRVLFGLDGALLSRMKTFEQLLVDAGIHAVATNEISREVWEKYILVSSSATATTYYNTTFGGVMEYHAEQMNQLLHETVAVARAKGVKLSDDIITVVQDRLRAIAYEATTSMHSDFLSGKQHNELSIMTGYIVKQGKALGVDVWLYEQMYHSLKQRTGEKYTIE